MNKYHYDGFIAVQIHNKLIDLFKLNATVYSAFAKILRVLYSKICSFSNHFPKICSSLGFNMSSLAPLFSAHVNVSLSTVYHYLMEVHELKKRKQKAFTSNMFL